MNTKKEDRVSQDAVIKAYKNNKGNIRATAKELGIERSTVRRKLEKTGLMKKPLVGGTKLGMQDREARDLHQRARSSATSLPRRRTTPTCIGSF